MRALHRQLLRRHLHSECWEYSSLFQPIEEIAQQLVATLRSLDESPHVQKIDLVTHSMGCIVSRVALLEYRPQKFGRWVMLAPPNHGSFIANLVDPLLGGRFKPIRQLTEKPNSFVRKLPLPDDLEIGLIIARYDMLIRESATRIPGLQDEIVIDTFHGLLPHLKQVADQTEHFFQHGKFCPESSANVRSIDS